MTNDAPHSAPTPLSRFLGGWMRHPSPQEPEQVSDDVEAAVSSEVVSAAVVSDFLADRVFWAALAARMAASSASGTPALRAAMSLRTSGTSRVSAPRKSVILREKRISWGASGAEGAATGDSETASAPGCDVGVGALSTGAPGVL